MTRLRRRVPSLLERHRVPGAAVGLVLDRDIRTVGFGLASSDPARPVREGTVFEAASLSKPVFAWLVLQMAARDEIDLDAPLSGYHGERIVDDPRLDGITARVVLSHGTGFPNWARDEPLSIRFDPGSRFGYSGQGYVYLQRAVERITRRPLEETMRQRVLEPLGMTRSHYVWVDGYDDAAAVGHDRRRQPTSKRRPDEANAAASLHTTGLDFARFLRAMLGAVPERRGMLELENPIDDALGWGLGWGLERYEAAGVPAGSSTADRAFWHWGDNGSFKAFALGSRARRRAVAIFTNGAAGLRLAQPVVEAVVPGEHPAFGFRLLNY